MPGASPPLVSTPMVLISLLILASLIPADSSVRAAAGPLPAKYRYQLYMP
jgi:hypothetical protein